MAFFLRLAPSARHAAVMTVLFGVFVTSLKLSGLEVPIPAALTAAVLALRLGTASLAVWFYLRGGVLLVCWAAFVIELRHLPGLLFGG